MHTARGVSAGSLDCAEGESGVRHEILELLIQRGYGLLEHSFMRGRPRAAEVVSGPRARQFQHAPAFFHGPLFGRHVRPRALPAAGRFFLLGFHRLRFKSSRHVFIVRRTSVVPRMSLAGTTRLNATIMEA